MLFNIIAILLHAVLELHFNRSLLSTAYFKVCFEVQNI